TSGKGSMTLSFRSGAEVLDDLAVVDAAEKPSADARAAVSAHAVLQAVEGDVALATAQADGDHHLRVLQQALRQLGARGAGLGPTSRRSATRAPRRRSPSSRLRGWRSRGSRYAAIPSSRSGPAQGPAPWPSTPTPASLSARGGGRSSSTGSGPPTAARRSTP